MRIHENVRDDLHHQPSNPTTNHPTTNHPTTNQPTTNQPTARGDIVGGITTFFTMAYIVVVNPTILASPGTGMPFSGALTATVLVACTMTLMMGLYARLPFAVAPGMGLNAFFAYTIVLQQQGDDD